MNDLVDMQAVTSGKEGTVAERVASELRGEIARGEWAVGDQLPAEHQLMDRFGISRPSCREALRILQSEGLVKVERGHRGGARVMPPDAVRIASYANVYLQMRSTTITEVFETRIAIEPAVIMSLTLNISRDLLSLLAQNVASQPYLIHDRLAYYLRCREFRQLLVGHCESESLRLLSQIIGEIADEQLSLLALRLPRYEGQEQRFLHAITIKEAMIAAMGEGRAEQAADLWRSYLRFYLANIRETTPAHLRNLKPFPLE